MHGTNMKTNKQILQSAINSLKHEFYVIYETSLPIAPINPYPANVENTVSS